MSGAVTPVSTDDNAAHPAVPVGRYPVYPAVDVSGDTLYVPNALSSSVTPVNLKTLSPGRPISAGTAPDALAITPDGSTLWVTDMWGGAHVIDGAVTPIATAHNAPGKAMAVGIAPIAIGITPESGYITVTSRGALTGYGSASYLSQPAPPHLSAPVVGMALDPRTGGVWIAEQDGEVLGVHAPSYGELPRGRHRPRDVVGIAAAPDGEGYWLASAQGTVTGFGSVKGVLTLHTDGTTIDAITFDARSGGFWLLGADGDVLAWHAPSYGNARQLARDGGATAIVATQDARGYWVVGANGAVVGLGNAAQFQPHLDPTQRRDPVVAVACGPATGGFWLATADGAVLAEGTPLYPRSTTGAGPVVAMVRALASTPQ